MRPRRLAARAKRLKRVCHEQIERGGGITDRGVGGCPEAMLDCGGFVGELTHGEEIRLG